MWEPGWYGFDRNSETGLAWGPEETPAAAMVHPDADESEDAEVEVFLVSARLDPSKFPRPVEPGWARDPQLRALVDTEAIVNVLGMWHVKGTI